MSATLEAFLIKEDGYVLSMMKQLASEVKVSEENMVLGLTLFPSLGRSSASTLLVLGLAIWKSQKYVKSCQIKGETASTWQKAVC